jgi:iron(III) transport system ATP-binding protein
VTVYDDHTNVPTNRRHVGMVFQSYAIWPHMTVFENVAFPLEMEGVAKTEVAERVTAMLREVGLAEQASRGASYLSGGQMQRVALARSLVMRPRVLLFDEPLSNLDARLRDHLRVQLRELQTQFKISSVYVTHDQREALALADTIVVMRAGTVLQQGDPISLYNRPASIAVADFLGYGNIFDAELVRHEAGRAEVRLPGAGATLAIATSAPPAGPLAICARPDKVTMREAAPGESAGPNVLLGEVILASFLGTYIQDRVRVSDEMVWEVYGPAEPGAITRGARVALEIAPESLFLLPKS